MNIFEDDLHDLIADQVAEEGLTLVEMKLARHGSSATLRIFADRPGGITLGECEKLSRKLALVLDSREIFDGRYLLEVSSPGLDRPLKTPQDFGLRIGENIKLFYRDEMGKSRQLVGKLDAAFDDRVTVVTEEGQFDIDMDMISRGQIIL